MEGGNGGVHRWWKESEYSLVRAIVKLLREFVVHDSFGESMELKE